MKNEKILIISRVFFPRLTPRAHRATELAIELARQGHNVTICAALGKYDYTDFQQKYGIRVHDLGISKFDWVCSDVENRNISLWRKGIIFLLRRWLEFPAILVGIRTTKYLKTSEKYDRMITIAVPYPIHWGATYAVRHYEHLKGTKWISDCGDPYMLNPLGTPPFYFKWVEKWWCKTTDYIAVPTEVAMDGYYPEFREKIRVIPQGFVFDDSLLAPYSKNPVPTFAYSGMVYPHKRDPRPFLDFLSQWNQDFRFIVYTNKPVMFMPFQEKLGNKMELRTYVPREQLLHELSKMDFLVNLRNESAVQAPSKLIDYYLTHRPILEITSFFEEKDAFMEFVNGDYHHQKTIDHPEQFNIVHVAHKFMEL